MTSRDFCYWLQGFFEVSGAVVMTEEQVTAVKAHLSMAFKHEIDPSFGDAKKQAALDELHKTKPAPHSGPPFGPPVMRC